MEYTEKTSFRQIVRSVENSTMTEENYKAKFKGLKVLALHILDKAEYYERKVPFREERLKKLTELHAPQVILDNEKRMLDELLIKVETYKEIRRFMLLCDELAEKKLLSGDICSYDAYVLEDALDAVDDRSCEHCAHSYMKDGKWVCSMNGYELEVDCDYMYSKNTEMPCEKDGKAWNFILDDLCETDYINFLRSNPMWGYEALEEMGVEKNEDGMYDIVDRLPIAVSAHHIVLINNGTKRFIKTLFPELTYEEAVQMFKDKNKRN